MHCFTLTSRQAALLLLIGFIGCGKPTPRTAKDIEKERRELPRLYLTAETKKQVKAAGNQGPFIDKATGEICYPAYTCTNPDCPASEGEKPVLFIHKDVLARVEAGEIVWDEIPADEDPMQFLISKGAELYPNCPACLKKRDVAKETPEQQQGYAQFAKPYILPETEKRAGELDAELRALKAN